MTIFKQKLPVYLIIPAILLFALCGCLDKNVNEEQTNPDPTVNPSVTVDSPTPAIEDQSESELPSSLSVIPIGEHDGYTYLFEPIPENEKRYVVENYRVVRQRLDGSEYLILEAPIAFEEDGLFGALYDGRIIFVGHKSEEIVDIKQKCFVSMALDGTDRQILETHYHSISLPTFCDGLIYYEGWTNAGAFPRPINTVNADLSQHYKLTDIEGAFITYLNGTFYWLDPNRTDIICSTKDNGSEVFFTLPEPVDLYRISHLMNDDIWTFYGESNNTYDVVID